ncbi:MAG: hypothetical protein K0R38_2878 [Polyangiaceae bacterium]|nr:hypothetical protein [Polyangiaceae bacterium]
MRAAPTLSVAVAILIFVQPLVAEPQVLAPTPGAGQTSDRFELQAQSQTYATLFRRALLPGPAGSLVQTETVLPVFEYVQVRARNLDSPWHRDSVDIELSGWGRALFTNNTFERPADGDVQTASVTYHQRGASFKLGRQQFVGGAARFARFDGAALETALGAGFTAHAYGGMTVLPRWNQRLSYYHLGSNADSLLRNPETFQQPERSGHWMLGGRLVYSQPSLTASASFHEQREQGELGHRNLGLDLRGTPTADVTGAVSAIVDTDAGRLADTRAWVDWTPATWLTGSLEYLHTEPALWLSRQSVLSVFSNDRFDEVGGIAKLRPLKGLTVEGLAFATLYQDRKPGGRVEATARFVVDESTLVRLSYARVVAPGNGYHSLRSSISRRFPSRLAATLEAYGYFYDEPIQLYDTSFVYAGTLSYEASARLNLLWGASLMRSPYAAIDAQTLVRANYAFDFPAQGAR